MVLKAYNEQTGKLEPISIVVNRNYTDDIGQSVTIPEEYPSIQESMNSKISKLGDIMEGSLEFSDKNGVIGTSSSGLEYSSTKIEYEAGTGVRKPGCFKVVTTTKDILDLENSENSYYFNLACDTIPTLNSKNLLTSGDIYTAIKALSDRIDILEQNNN